MKHIFLLSTIYLLLFSSPSQAQQLVANINLSNAGSSPTRLMGNDEYGAFFARPDGGAYQLFYLPSGSDSLLRLSTVLPLTRGTSIRASALIGDEVYFRFDDSNTGEGIILRANLTKDSLYSVFTLPSSGLAGNFTAIDGTDDVLFINRNRSNTFQLYRTDGTVAGTQFQTDLPDNEFVSQIASQDSFAYLVYPGDFFSPNIPAKILLYDGQSTRQVSFPTQARFMEVEAFSDKVLVSAFSADSINHFLASPDLGQYRSLTIFPNDTNTLGLRLAFIDDDQLYFTRDREGFVHELLRTDTAATRLDTIVDLNPNLDSLLFFDHSYDPSTGLLYYLANNNRDRSVSLYRSDLTEAGTFPLTVVQPAGTSITNISSSNLLVDGLFYFKAIRDSSGEELWVSDGTINGTKPLLDLVPGMDDAEISDLRRFGNSLGFRANSLDLGEEVFLSDGSSLGTRLLKDINQTEAGSNPNNFFSFKDSLFFIASDDCFGAELFKSGGTAASTGLVKDFIPGREGYFMLKPLRVGDRIYYLTDQGGIGNKRLLETDGTEAGTREVFTNIASLDILDLSAPGHIGDDLLVSAYSGLSSSQQLFRFNPNSMTVDTLAFLSNVGINSNGDCFYPLSDSISLFLPYINSRRNLYRTDGSSQGTFPLPLAGLATPLSISRPRIIQNLAYFNVIERTGVEHLYRSDGTTAGTVQLNSSPFSIVRDIFSYRGEPHFFADNASGTDLYRIDPQSGAISQTALISSDILLPGNIRPKGDSLFFTATTDSLGSELWMIAGPGQIAAPIIDLRTGPLSSTPGDLKILDGQLYFSAQGNDGIRDLYVTNGSAQGTVKVRSISGSTTGYAPQQLFIFEDILYFSAVDSQANRELFRFNPAAPTDTTGLADRNLGAHCPDPNATVSIEDVALDRAISIYPNPTTDRLAIRLTDHRQQLELMLFSPDGRLLGKQNMQGNYQELTLRGLPAGVYSLRLVDLEKGGEVVRRIVKY